MKIFKNILYVVVIILLASCEKDTDPTLLAPVLTVEEPSNLNRTVATLNGKLAATDLNAVVEVGFKIGEASDLGDSKEYSISDFTIGEMSVDVKDLEIGKTYFYALYARNGITEQLSQIKAFTTLTNSTALPGEMNMDENTGKWSSSILDDGGSVVTTKGFCWDTNPNPTVFKNRMLVETTDFSAIAPSLGGGTYYIRAFVQNDKGIGYGKESVYTVSGPVFINIPDPVLKDYLLNRYDANGDGAIDTDEALDVKEIGLWRTEVASLEGIQHFINLVSLDVYSDGDIYKPEGKLTSIDVSKNLKLERLVCGWNQLTSLDITHNTKLKMLYCSGNFQLSELDISKNVELIEITAQHVKLTALDFTKAINLEDIHIGSGGMEQISVVDVRNCSKLWRLIVDVPISSLDVSKNPGLKYLSVSSPYLTQMDISANLSLTTFSSSSCPIFTDLYMKSGQKIEEFYIPQSAVIHYK